MNHTSQWNKHITVRHLYVSLPLCLLSADIKDRPIYFQLDAHLVTVTALYCSHLQIEGNYTCLCLCLNIWQYTVIISIIQLNLHNSSQRRWMILSSTKRACTILSNRIQRCALNVLCVRKKTHNHTHIHVFVNNQSSTIKVRQLKTTFSIKIRYNINLQWV